MPLAGPVGSEGKKRRQPVRVKKARIGIPGGVKDQARGLARIEVKKINRPVKGGRIGAAARVEWPA
jgi:hypothetical protein